MTQTTNDKFAVRPILGRIIIEVEDPELMTLSGKLHLPHATVRGQRLDSMKGCVGRIVAIDESKPPDDVNVGDRVAVATGWLGDVFTRDGKHYRTVEGDDCSLHAEQDVHIEFQRA